MSTGMNVLVVGNDDFELETLCVLLSQCGEFNVLTAKSGAEALAAVRDAQIDVVVCDTETMPLADSTAIRDSAAERSAECLLLERRGIGTGGTSDLNSEPGVGARAAKPLAIRELVGQIKLLLDRVARKCPDDVRFGPFSLERGARLRRLDDGSEIFLTDKEAKILRLLSSAANGFATSGELMASVWGYHESANSHTLQTHIYSLRRKLETDPNNPRVLFTEKGGYRLAQ